MSAILVEAVGGPLDGTRYRTSLGRCSFLWLDERRAWRGRSEGRELYRLDVRVRNGWRSYLYAGRTHALCSGCSSYHVLSDGNTCSLCGSTLCA